MFLGAHMNGVDAKGRVSVPADFRAVARAEGLEGVYCWRAFEGPYLEGGGARRMRRFQAAIEAMDPYDEARQAFEQVIFGGARLLAFDATGRITVPKEFLAHADLAGEAAFIGLGERFEIRAPEAHAERYAAAVGLARQNKGALRPGAPPQGEMS
ncbi:MAG: hypothetical protein MI723_04515 [Caulobacterales bacterium]|nr:hypothetical protein [Caulobacterales bacterium]